MKTILLTGSAGFIGHHLTISLINSNFKVIGIDSINSYYDVNLKLDRLSVQGFNIDKIILNNFSQNSIISSKNKNCIFYHNTINDYNFLNTLYEIYKPDIIINLAAQAGVRYSITNPKAYLESNIDGFLNILECTKNHNIKHLYYASSSSVYGLNSKTPFNESDTVDSPASMYATTKKCNELMAHTYSHLFKFNCTGLRFFTVYGPYGRPDMAIFLFTEALLNNKEIKVFNNGNLVRDFTYIDDITKSILILINNDLKQDLTFDANNQCYKIYNIGNNHPVKLMDFIKCIEESTSKSAIIKNTEMQQGDVKITHANIDKLIAVTNFIPNTTIKEGVEKFVKWYLDYYKIN